MIFVELGDDLQHRLDRLEIALLEIEVDDAHRLGQPQHLQVNVMRAAIELALFDRLGGGAPHALDAELQAVGDLDVAHAGGIEPHQFRGGGIDGVVHGSQVKLSLIMR